MKITDKVINLIKYDVADKDVLEVACGRADLSVALSPIARAVDCIDLVDFRLNPDICKHSNVKFSLMNAAQMTFADGSFDTAIIYNAAYHIKDELSVIISECMRVIRSGGAIYVISSVSIDRAVIDGDLVTLLNGIGAQFTVERGKTLISVKIVA